MTLQCLDWGMSVPVRLEVSDVDRLVLESRVRASTTSRRDWQRAMIVLLSTEGLNSAAIGQIVGLSRVQTDTWRNRYKGLSLAGLVDEKRSGCPPTYGPQDRLTLVKTITTRPVEIGQSAGKRVKARMSIPEVAALLNSEHGIGISYSQTWRICKALSLKPWQVRSWMTSHDPCFDDKATDVCALYLSPEANWAVFSVDEKTGMQAKSRVNKTKPALPAEPNETTGKPVLQEFEYKRHGTTSLFAAFNCDDGQVFAQPTQSTSAINFVGFLTALDHEVPAHLELHCIVDNLSAHGTAAVEEFLDEHPRIFLHRTPTHASWLNQVEMWFSILTRQLLNTAEFESTTDLAGAILDFITIYNTKAKKIKWTYNTAK
jgi:transposase